MEAPPPQQPKFLIIRRDNIGDLVCTTPTITALRQAFPNAYIAALVTTYTTAVLDHNPDIDAVFTYTKLKHRTQGQSWLATLWHRLQLMMSLRRMRFDYLLLTTPRYQPRLIRFGKWIAPRALVAFVDAAHAADPDIQFKITESTNGALHEVEDAFRILAPFGVTGPPPPCRVIAAPDQVMAAQLSLAQQGWNATSLLIGVHISARKPSQRWPIERYVALIKMLHQHYAAHFLLLWSPGAEDNPLHPGDDNKAAEIMRGLENIPVLAFHTHTLKALIGGLSVCDFVICSDGGAMHLAAALGKPMVCFFGKSDAARWHPWGVPHVVLQTPSREVGDIGTPEALSVLKQLIATTNT